LSRSAAPVRYTITPSHPEAHLFEVICTVAVPDPAGQRFTLPAWIPGSYMIREFARHIVRIRAESGGRRVALKKLDKHTWRAAPCAGSLTLSYEVYAWDLSVRCAHLDTSHGFFNGSQVFLAVAGAEQGDHLVDIRPPAGEAYRGWRVATTLAEARGHRGAARRYGFGLYRAADYAELVDHPVEMGHFELVKFEAAGVAHEMAITGRIRADLKRLAADLRKICAWQIRLFGGRAPFERYLFLVYIVGEGYGGLEHRSSTALICGRNDLPAIGDKTLADGYVEFLGLCSHEYFHAWNVKRIKPAAFAPYDLARENYTRLLWVFEGFTSYYDDLALRRSGVIPVDTYLARLAKTVSTVQRGTGRFKQSLADASFDAWIKFYRPDENTPNATVNYYAKGALVALALDLKLRGESRGRVSLDDVMRALWQRYGKTGEGVPEDGIREVAEAVSGLRFGPFFAAAVDGTADLPLQRLLGAAGFELALQPAGTTPSLGIKTAAEGAECKLSQVLDGGAAQAAGLSAGDTLLAIDGLRVTATNLDKLLGRYRAGDAVRVHAFRRDELFEVSATLQAPNKETARIVAAAKPAATAARLRREWLGETRA
jgi:predicted metalloprotease with PDZ domain